MSCCECGGHGGGHGRHAGMRSQALAGYLRVVLYAGACEIRKHTAHALDAATEVSSNAKTEVVGWLLFSRLLSVVTV